MKFHARHLNILLLALLNSINLNCQPTVYKTPSLSIPTAGNSWVANDTSLESEVITNIGITNWTDKSSTIRTYYRADQTGILNLSIRAKVSSGSSVIINIIFEIKLKGTLIK